MKFFSEKQAFFYLLVIFMFIVCLGCGLNAENDKDGLENVDNEKLREENETGADEAKADYPPAVMWNDRVYSIESPSTNKENIGNKLGEVAFYLDYGVPTKNGESNCYEVGSIIYAHKDDDRKIIVEWVDPLTNATHYTVLMDK